MSGRGGKGRTQGGLRNESRDGIYCQMGITLFDLVTFNQRKVQKMEGGWNIHFLSASLSQTTIPLLLGAVRAIGRFSTPHPQQSGDLQQHPWLISKLFPVETLHKAKPKAETRFPTIPDYSGFSNFR